MKEHQPYWCLKSCLLHDETMNKNIQMDTEQFKTASILLSLFLRALLLSNLYCLGIYCLAFIAANRNYVMHFLQTSFVNTPNNSQRHLQNPECLSKKQTTNTATPHPANNLNYVCRSVQTIGTNLMEKIFLVKPIDNQLYQRNSFRYLAFQTVVGRSLIVR